MVVVTLGRHYNTGEKPPLCCTLTLIAMQGYQTKTKQNHFEYIIKQVYNYIQYNNKDLSFPASILKPK